MTDIQKNVSKVKVQHIQEFPLKEVVKKEEAVYVKTKKEKKRKMSDEDEEYEIKQKHQSVQSRWTMEEDLMYMRFLMMNKKFFECENTRRTGKVFMHLSKMMNGARTPNQCKSHHQKMQMASKTGMIDQIVGYIEKKHMLNKVKEEYTHISCLKKQEELYRVHHSTNLKGFEIRVFLRVNNIEEW